MENNEGGKVSKKLSPPRTLPLTSLRISEGKRSSPTGIGSSLGRFLGSQQDLLAQDQNYWGGHFSPHNLSTLLLSAPKQQKGFGTRSFGFIAVQETGIEM
jgi:hypothetical protein